MGVIILTLYVCLLIVTCYCDVITVLEKNDEKLKNKQFVDQSYRYFSTYLYIL